MRPARARRRCNAATNPVDALRMQPAGLRGLLVLPTPAAHLPVAPWWLCDAGWRRFRLGAARQRPDPLSGGFIALANLSVVFVVAAIVSGLAAIPIATVPNVRLARSAEAPVGALRIARRLLPLIILGVGTSYMIGTFDTIWSLYMTYRGATRLAVGISFATFGIPALLVSVRAGALGDRFGAHKLTVGSLFVTAFFSS